MTRSIRWNDGDREWGTLAVTVNQLALWNDAKPREVGWCGKLPREAGDPGIMGVAELADKFGGGLQFGRRIRHQPLPGDLEMSQLAKDLGLHQSVLGVVFCQEHRQPGQIVQMLLRQRTGP